jgi:hypothetical protein
LAETTRQGITHIEVIICKICGLSQPGKTPQAPKGATILEVEGCEYKVPDASLVNFLGFFGEIYSEIVEDTVEDGISPNGDVGTNGTETYSVKVKLLRSIPQLIFIMRKRVKIYFPGILKLCQNCFGPHSKHACHSKHVQWKTYISNFMSTYQDIEMEKWA